ncbi:hypothetical protein PG997_014632 [Apiospora hydei]|uniref:Uncharacterized protein n=1 Tax=Apiospora hydei TaxID=1337664 RepID=A0ABR1UUD5_9PEZI
MLFDASAVAVLASLAVLASAMPVFVGNNEGINGIVKRVPCPASKSTEAASADYKRGIEDEDALGDDTPGAIIACNF